MTSFCDRSKALALTWLSFTYLRWIPNSRRVENGKMLTPDPPSTITWDTTLSLHLTVICRALFVIHTLHRKFIPSKKVHVCFDHFPMVAANASLVVFIGKLTPLSTFTKASLWPSELINKSMIRYVSKGIPQLFFHEILFNRYLPPKFHHLGICYVSSLIKFSTRVPSIYLF